MRKIKITLLMAALAGLLSSCIGMMIVDYSVFGKYVFHNDTKEDITVTFDMQIPGYMIHDRQDTTELNNFCYSQTISIFRKDEHTFWHPIDLMTKEEIVESTDDLIGFFDNCRYVTFTLPDGTSVTHYNPKFYPEDNNPKNIFLSSNYKKEDYYARDGLIVADKSYPIYHFHITNKIFK